MTERDLSEVQHLVVQLGYPCTDRELRERFLNLINLPNHALRVWKDDRVRGVMHLEEVYDLIEENKVEIKALVVDEKTRSMGIGRALIQEAGKWAKERGCSIAYLNCNIKRDRTHAFYLREGFTLQKTSHFFERKF